MSVGDHDNDKAWYDALSGAADDGSREAREGTALRRVLLKEDRRTRTGERSNEMLEKLTGRLEDEVLLERERPAQRRRPRWYALAASLTLAALVVPLVVQITQQPEAPLIEIPRGAVEPVEVTVADPESTSAELAAALHELGAVVKRYSYAGAWIVDAEVVEVPPRRVRKVLKQYNIAVPEGGRVLLAFVAG